ncbi:hypothetical protein [Acidovorax cavernicola]|uniref:Uncharacterized protein n=1 Tax=Acidovorax cavernicola TaxID=1675792 RepID=A0A9X8CZK8_9BURK|nr:hypothetical protein [Acidovorax cavernicola]RIX74007.1 hypothetical protein D3H34_28095 [Acidovorax cavernicola]
MSMVDSYKTVGNRSTTPTASQHKPVEVKVAPVMVDYTLHYHYPDLDNTPVRGVTYRATMVNGETRTGTLDNNGNAVLSRVEAGPVRVEYQYDQPDADDEAILKAREQIQKVLDRIVAQTRVDMAAEWKQWDEAGEIKRQFLKRGNAALGTAVGAWNWASGTAHSIWQLAVLVYKLDNEKRELNYLLVTGQWSEIDRRIAGYRAQGKKVLDFAGQLKESLILIWHDEKVRQIILKFPPQWWAAIPPDEQEALASAGGAEIVVDVLVGVLLAAFTAGVAGAAYASAKWAVTSARLGGKLVELLDALKDAFQVLARALTARKRKTVEFKSADSRRVIETEWKPPPVNNGPPGLEHALVNGTKVFPHTYTRLFHGSNKSTLGFPESMPNKEVAASIYRDGLPARGQNIDLAEHARGVDDRAFRGTTEMLQTPDGQGGATLWADEGGLVIELRNVKGYDVNELLEGRVRKPDGTFGGNAMNGEHEIAVPGAISSEQIESVGEVVKNARGQLIRRVIPRP